jgi:hypothetical protein
MGPAYLTARTSSGEKAVNRVSGVPPNELPKEEWGEQSVMDGILIFLRQQDPRRLLPLRTDNHPIGINSDWRKIFFVQANTTALQMAQR